MTHVVKIDILTGHVKKGSLHFILNIFFIACLSKTMHFLRTCTVYYESIVYRLTKLHGPSMFAVKAKIYGAIYYQSSSTAIDETSSYWSAPKNS